MAKLIRHIYYSFKCPGCGHEHNYHIEGENKIWNFNGDMNKPTFTPSLLNTWTEKNGDSIINHRCHLFIINGQIQYCSDCTHSLANQTVELPNIE